MAPHSSTLAWKILWMEEPGRLRSMGSRRVGQDRATSLSLFTFMHWRRKWQPTLVFLAWRIPGTGEPGGLLSMGSHRVGHDWSDLASAAVNAGIVEVMLFLRVAPETPCSVSTSTPAWGPGTGFSQPETLLGIWDTHPARAGDLILYLKNFYLGAISSLSFMGYYEASKLLLL